MGTVVALGCGLVGRFVIERLIEAKHEVIVIDLTIPDSLRTNPLIEAKQGDALEHIKALEPNQTVVNMLPGRIGDLVRAPLLQGGHNVVDLAFTAEDPHRHQALAEANDSVLLWDVGIAPGISNMLVKQAYEALGPLNSVSIKVGGNPCQMDDEWSYMAPFSPSDVIEEYTRPARIRVDGVTKEVPALTERHAIEVEGYGTMEAFLTDGLRSVLDTIPCQTMKEYTVRWPGHIDRWISEGQSMNENDLLKAWTFDPQRKEFTWLEVVASNDSTSRRTVVQDSGLKGDGSMARTTGLVTAACALLFLEHGPKDGCGLNPGIHPPEGLSAKAISHIMDYMKSEGVEFSSD
jgi:saccharopine dehydrogenase-like NADP-dependent oxidoreductase